MRWLKFTLAVAAAASVGAALAAAATPRTGTYRDAAHGFTLVDKRGPVGLGITSAQVIQTCHSHRYTGSVLVRVTGKFYGTSNGLTVTGAFASPSLATGTSSVAGCVVHFRARYVG